MATDRLKTCPDSPKKGCRCSKLTINNLWSVWYCVVVLGIEIYLITTNIQKFTIYIDLPWPENSDPRFELNAYVGLIGAAILLIPFFVISSVVTVGNLPNDGHKLGIGESGDPELLLPDYYISNSIASKLRRLWRHCGPTAPLLHICSALCLILPKLLIQAKLINHGFLLKDDIWKTDLDFMIMHQDRLVVLEFLTSLNSSSVLAKEAGLSSDLFVKMSPPEIQLQELSHVSPEFINFALALLVYAIRYPSVFWHTSRSFGLLFSAQMVLNAAQILLAFAGFTVLYNVHVIGASKCLVIYDPHFLLGPRASVLMFAAYCLLLVSFGCVVYFYGYLKYRENVAKESQKSHITLLGPDYRAKCCGYAPHVAAFVLLCITSMCAGPLMYDFIVVYRGSLDGAVLAGVFGTIFHLLFWILFWLGLTIKQKWKFRILISGSQSKLTDPSSLLKIAHEIEMTSLKHTAESVPLLVIGRGETFTVREPESKTVILKAAKNDSKPKKSDEEDIYWLKPHPTSPKPAKSSESIKSKNQWLSRKGRAPSFKGSKVSFEDSSLMAESPYGKTTKPASKSPKSSAKLKRKVISRIDSDSDDGGDYATLRGDLPRVREVDEDKMITDFTPLSPDDNDEDYVDYGYLSESYPVPMMLKAPVTVHNHSYDSGMPTRCDSVSDASSVTPQDKVNGSESSSSGNYSMSDKRASSLEELPLPTSPNYIGKNTWKNLSLQRNVPTSLPLHNNLPSPNIVLFNTHYNHRDSHLYSDPIELPPSTMVIRHKGRPTSVSVPTLAKTGEKFGRKTNVHLSSFTEEPEYTAVRKKYHQNAHKRKYPGSTPISQHINDLNQSPIKNSNCALPGTKPNHVLVSDFHQNESSNISTHPVCKALENR